MSQTAITIPKDTSTQNDLDYAFLRAEGQRHLEKIATQLWTDYNTHDPGITMLEMLCYAITDLSLRIETPIEDLVKRGPDDIKVIHKQFISAINILPTKPVTALDYRKLFVHLKGVKNAWIKPHAQTIYVNCQEEHMSYTSLEGLDDEVKTKAFDLQGLNDIYIDFEDDVTEAEEAMVIDKVHDLYHDNRNLCEDLVEICKVPEQHIWLCAYIDIDPEADEEYILAQILIKIEDYFSPSVDLYSLEQMYDKGYTTDRIFEGPIPFPDACVAPTEEALEGESEVTEMQGGFIDGAELEKAELRKEIRLSDLIHIIMDIKGVKVIKDIAMKPCGEEEFDPWIICMKENHKPVLCWNAESEAIEDEGCGDCNSSIFNFTKGLLPIGVNTNKVIAFINEFKAEKKKNLDKIKTEDVSFPEGSFTESDHYTTIQNDFPETYGITEVGLPSTVSKQRKAKAKQLQAYLLFFDQILANYFAHLGKVKDLLSVEGQLVALYTFNSLGEVTDEKLKQTFFSQEVEDIKEYEQITEANIDDRLVSIMNSLKTSTLKNSDTVFYEHRNQLLDHLIARFAEKFSDYVFIMKSLYGDSANLEILKAKAWFLRDYKKISCERGRAFNYCHGDVWDTDNVNGVQKRIARLTGVQDFTRRDLLKDTIEVYHEDDEDGITEYRWRIRHDDGTILLSSSKHYHSQQAAFAELLHALDLAKDESNFEQRTTASGTFTYYNLVDPTVSDTTSEAYVVARRIAYKKLVSEAEAMMQGIVAFLNDKAFEEEGMYMIEHILLRPDLYNSETVEKLSKEHPEVVPDASPEDFMTACLDADCVSCGPLDPYSFRITVILPGWMQRFGNLDFRKYMERIIRTELPAHVLARICWIGHVKGIVPDEENHMLQIQTRYKAFLEQLKGFCENPPTTTAEIETYRDTRNEFTACLNNIHTIYPPGRLHDCNNDSTEAEGNKIILGRTNIGEQ